MISLESAALKGSGMTRIDPATSYFLDATRWMAALAVVVAHVCTLAMVTDVHVTHPGAAVRVMTYLGNVGHLAVVIFFVVSGYLVGGQEFLRLQDGARFSASRYGIQRFSRIYTVLVPALVMTFVFDWLGRALVNGSEFYTRPPPELMYLLEPRETLMTFVGNLLMLQNIAVETFGSDGPLWSLANEWWYYVVFGLVLVSITQAGEREPGWRLAALAGAVGLMGVLPAGISVWFVLWLMGVGLAILGRRWGGLRYRTGFMLMIAGFLLALLGMRLTELLWTQPRAVLNAYSLCVDGVAAAAFGVGLLSARRAVFRGDGTVHRALAGFSFSLYAVHYPAMLFILAAAHDWLGIGFIQPLGLRGFALSAATVGLLVGYAWCFAAVTERHTPAVRAALTRLLVRRVRPV